MKQYQNQSSPTPLIPLIRTNCTINIEYTGPLMTELSTSKVPDELVLGIDLAKLSQPVDLLEAVTLRSIPILNEQALRATNNQLGLHTYYRKGKNQ